MSGKSCFGFWVGILLSSLCWGMDARTALVNPHSPKVDLAPVVSVLEDPGGRLTRQDLERPEIAQRFVDWDARRGDVNLAFSSSAWWVRVRLQRTADAPRTWILDSAYAYNKYLDFYAPDAAPVLTGHARPLHSRPIFSRHFAFPVSVNENAQDFYLRIESHYAVSLPLVLWQASAYAENTLKILLLEFLYYGALLMLVIYNGFLWWSLRDIRFGYYAVFGLFLNAGMFAANGLGAVYLWPGANTFDEIAWGVFYGLASLFFIAFCRSFLQTRRFWPALDRVLLFVGLGYTILVALFVALMDQTFWIAGLFQVMVVLWPLSVALIWMAMVKKQIRHQPGANYFILAWFCLGLGLVVTMLRAFDWVPTNGLTSYSGQIGSAIEMVLFSFALAAVVRDERQQRIQAQADMLKAKEEVIGLLKEGEVRLESAVKQRTQDLHHALQREQGTLAQYLRFAALVTHEFRNRLNVISSQSDMLNKEVPVQATARRTEVIKRSVDHLANLTQRWLHGDRLLHSEIHAAGSSVSLLPWLQSLWDKSPQYGQTHQLVLDAIPGNARLYVDPELLEIAVGNLIDNACKYSPVGSEIQISLIHQRGMIGIAVRDQGPGIPKDDQLKIFEPYVRLIPEGTIGGIGLGLNFVQRIAQAHGGRVSLDSSPGKGSTFVIWFADERNE
jgi:signal transduction histidine kinase